MKDPYRSSAGVYDRLFEGMNKGLRLIGIRVFRPNKGMNILDVGCGTGTHLELYQRYQCQLYGLDLSPAMLEVARKRLAGSAQLDLGDAAHMPYENGKFDLAICMLTLHEMPPASRPLVVEEIRRVLTQNGRILLIDYHTGPYQPMQGWISKIIITFAEIAAGANHNRNYHNFMKQGGLVSLIAQHGLNIEKQQILAGGTFGVYLAHG